MKRNLKKNELELFRFLRLFVTILYKKKKIEINKNLISETNFNFFFKL